jgi:hypothetical protein
VRVTRPVFTHPENDFIAGAPFHFGVVHFAQRLQHPHFEIGLVGKLQKVVQHQYDRTGMGLERFNVVPNSVSHERILLWEDKNDKKNNCHPVGVCHKSL